MATTTPQARAQIVADALETANAQPDAGRIRLSWKDGEYTAPVKIPPSSVVLDPRSHRIRSQLEFPAQQDVVARDPFSEDARNVIAEILRSPSLELRHDFETVTAGRQLRCELCLPVGPP
jgi:hypothetical protein